MITNLLPYSGCKLELLPNILKLIPTVGIAKINDVFGGSGTFALNVAETFPFIQVNYNEYDPNVFNILTELKDYSPLFISNYIKLSIEKYGLNAHDEDTYTIFKNHINEERDLITSGLGDLVLTRHAFSSTCRWSKKTGFNMPFGKRTWVFDDFWLEELVKTNKQLNANIEMHNQSFDDYFNANPATPDTVDYIDPPYLITKAVYNQGWTDDVERKLYEMIDQRVENGVNFILSNVIEHKGLTNQILIDWMAKYNVRYVDKNYRIARTSNEDNKTVEVIVTNLPINDDMATLEDFLY